MIKFKNKEICKNYRCLTNFEIDNLELGGGWNANFLNYMEIDIYICKDGIEYNENNKIIFEKIDKSQI